MFAITQLRYIDVVQINVQNFSQEAPILKIHVAKCTLDQAGKPFCGAGILDFRLRGAVQIRNTCTVLVQCASPPPIVIT